MSKTPKQSHDAALGTLEMIEDHVTWVRCQPVDPDARERAGGPFVRRMDRWRYNAVPSQEES